MHRSTTLFYMHELILLPSSKTTLILLASSKKLVEQNKNHFYTMKRDIGMADYEKQVQQDFYIIIPHHNCLGGAIEWGMELLLTCFS